MKLLVLTNMYPKNNALYRNAFVHSRNLQYINNGFDVTVFVLLNNGGRTNSYIYDGIKVLEGHEKELVEFIMSAALDKVLIHFINPTMIRVLNQLNHKIPTIVWIHGVEALGWYRRIFNFNGLSFAKYIATNTYQMFSLRSYIRKSKNVEFVFVSNWMKQITETDTLTDVPKFHVIPNIIDTKLFTLDRKTAEHRKKILLIRPFESKKYANDIAIKAILQLSRKPIFNNLQITIFGEGKYFESLVGPIKQFSNISINQRYLSRSEIAAEHRKNGIFLCPTRQDSQGVSMCEAMASGLVPVTSDNTAIPEFVSEGQTGWLTRDYKEIADRIEWLYNHPDKFIKMSKNASHFINQTCGVDYVTKKELQLIESNEQLGVNF